MRDGQDGSDRTAAVGDIEIGALGGQFDIVKPALWQREAAQGNRGVEVCGIRTTLQGKIEAVDEGLNFTIAEWPAEIHRVPAVPMRLAAKSF